MPSFYRWKSGPNKGRASSVHKTSISPTSLWAPESFVLPWVKALTTPCCRHFHALPPSFPCLAHLCALSTQLRTSIIFIHPATNICWGLTIVQTFWLSARSSLNKLMVKAPPGLVDRAATYSHTGCALHNFKKCHSHRLLFNLCPLDLCSAQPI